MDLMRRYPPAEVLKDQWIVRNTVGADGPLPFERYSHVSAEAAFGDVGPAPHGDIGIYVWTIRSSPDKATKRFPRAAISVNPAWRANPTPRP